MICALRSDIEQNCFLLVVGKGFQILRCFFVFFVVTVIESV
jgi:hypothetical protein